MNEVVYALIFGSIAFLLIFIIYYFFILKRKYNIYIGKRKGKKKNNLMDQMEITYLISKFKLDPKKMNVLYTLRFIALINAFIISFTATFIYYLPWKGIFWKFLVGFGLLFGLIYALYEILGRHLSKKGWKK